MKVFISWSGELSHKVALSLRDWLPSVIQAVEPYVSSEDIDKGARWSTDISKELESSQYGILCVTKSNVDAPWLNFEAGALSKFFDKSRVSPFLFNVKRSEIKGPVLQFQSTVFEKEDVFKLVRGINDAQTEGRIIPERLQKIFDVWWPELEKKLTSLPVEAGAAAPTQPTPQTKKDAILEELLDLVRRQHLILNSPEKLLPLEYMQQVTRRPALEPDHPIWFDLGSTIFSLCEAAQVLRLKEPTVECIERVNVYAERVRDLFDFLSRRMGVRNALAADMRVRSRRRTLAPDITKSPDEGH
ncbi:MAG: TIR domain-containing protein [Chthoniobacter sp.]|nr:TIR domain-containing protein [Chthoniobacter sp.]